MAITADFQSHNELGQTVATEYLNAARRAGRPFLPVIMTCRIEENMQRVRSVERQSAGGGKLLDPDVLEGMRRRSKLLSFGEPEMDVTELSSQQAAIVLRDYVSSKTSRVE